MTQAVDDYLAMRRALGYKLAEHGRVLPQFAAFLAQRGECVITTAVALEFATQPAEASVVWWHQRLAIVRGFARYLQAFDARHEVPPVNLLPATFRRTRPYLFSEAEIEALLAAARLIRPPLRAASCEAVIGLLAVSGMRVSEACGLDRSDVELGEDRLTVRQAKNGRSREIPLHPSTVTALDRYVRARDELCPDPKHPDAFFLSGGGGRLSRHFVWKWFDQLRRATGLDQETLGRRARLHDVRHSYVLRTLVGWYQEGGDIEARLPLLSTVLGHVHPADTFWYFDGAPELLALAYERLEQPGKRSPPQTNPPPTRKRACRCPGSAPDGADHARRAEGTGDERARATAAGVFHRASRSPTRRQPPHDRVLPRQLPAALDVPARADRHTAIETAARGSQPGEDHRIPLALGERARQQRPDPQRALDRDPLVLPVRGIQSPGVL